VSAALAGALAPLAAAKATTIATTTATRVDVPPGSAHNGCPVLILSAMPLEAAPIIAASSVNPNPVWVHNGKGFWSATVEGNQAIIAVTGIGLENATQTTDAAFAHFPCLSAVVFSGTSGGDFIGDVMVPARWTQDGKTFVDTSTKALAVLNDALNQPNQPVALEQTTPVGDPLCLCAPAGPPVPSSATVPITVKHKPKVEVGGAGLSMDGFGGRTFPCIPQASDVFGCWPCRFPDTATPTQAANLASTVPPFLEPSFVLGYQSASAPPAGTFVSQDMETAAVFGVASAHGVPFIGFRAASDGGGDPLMLPGFPTEFFVYRQLAADNAASVALFFLGAWHTSHP